MEVFIFRTLLWFQLLNTVVPIGGIFKIPLQQSLGYVSEDILRSSPMENNVDNLLGQPGLGYYVTMGIGTPPQNMNVLVDTGSSNFAIACSAQSGVENYFNITQSKTFHNESIAVSVPYTQGKWSGYLGRDTVSIPSLNLTVPDVNIACITQSERFFINGSHWGGILGLAFADIARPDSSVKPMLDSAVDMGLVNDSFSMQLCGISHSPGTEASMIGNLVLGGASKDLYVGQMYFAPITKPWYYEVVISDIKVNERSLHMDCKEYNFDKTIVDSGTTNMRLPKRVFKRIIEEIKTVTQSYEQYLNIPNAFWEGSENEVLCPAEGTMPWQDFPSIQLHLVVTHNTTFGLVVQPQQYLRPVRDIYDASKVCYKFAISSSETGTVLGAVVMEGFYIVFDRENKQMGFAETACDHSTSNALHIIPYEVDGTNHWDCGYVKPNNSNSSLYTVAYVMAGVCGACLIPLIVMVLHWQYNKCRRNMENTASQQDIGGLLDEDVSASQ